MMWTADLKQQSGAKAYNFRHLTRQRQETNVVCHLHAFSDLRYDLNVEKERRGDQRE